MPTALQMITSGLRKIGEYSTGETLGSDVTADGLAVMNTMLEGWSLERLMCYQVTEESFSLSASVGQYTIGAGAALSTTARPTKIVDPCFIRDSAGLDSPLRIIDATAYGRIVQKTVDGSYPAYLYYDQGYDSSGFGTISLYPEPQANLTLFINSWKQLQNLSTLTTDLAMPAGYRRAIEFNFAIEFATEFGRSVSPEIAKVAKESKAAIKSLNAPSVFMRLDYGVGPGTTPNILTGP